MSFFGGTGLALIIIMMMMMMMYEGLVPRNILKLQVRPPLLKKLRSPETPASSSLPLALDIFLITFGHPAGLHITLVDEDAYALSDRLAFF
jgi:hypothetical protein